MSEIEEPRMISGWWCDNRRCPVALRLDKPITLFARAEDGRFLSAAILDERGWSVWAGRGGRRHYCPLHGPNPGHKMRQVV